MVSAGCGQRGTGSFAVGTALTSAPAVGKLDLAPIKRHGVASGQVPLDEPAKPLHGL